MGRNHRAVFGNAGVNEEFQDALGAFAAKICIVIVAAARIGTSAMILRGFRFAMSGGRTEARPSAFCTVASTGDLKREYNNAFDERHKFIKIVAHF